MIDFAQARQMMVDGQIRTSDVNDLDLIAAFLEVPRERFVPPSQAAFAYADRDVPLTAFGANGRYLLRPMVLAKLLQAAAISASDRVLDVGCATGYSSALLARLAASVVALETHPGLAQVARDTLAAMGASNVTVVTGALEEGWPALGPYDVIVVNGAMQVEPVTLFRQLQKGGRLVGIMGTEFGGKAMVFVRDGDAIAGREIFDAKAPILPGFARAPAFVF